MPPIEQVLLTVLAWFGLFVVGYYAVINVGYLLLHVLALFELREDVQESRWNPAFRKFSSPFYPGIGIVVPAYNEEATIVESVRSMLSLNYPEIEVVVVNDGSTDSGRISTLKPSTRRSPSRSRPRKSTTSTDRRPTRNCWSSTRTTAARATPSTRGSG